VVDNWPSIQSLYNKVYSIIHRRCYFYHAILNNEKVLSNVLLFEDFVAFLQVKRFHLIK